MDEKDPTGKSAHEPGAKLDSGKLRPHLVFSGFANALDEVVKVGTDGAAKYSDNGWREVPNGEQRYLDAMERHLQAFRKGEEHDPMSGSRHMAHVVWNALAVMELQAREVPVKRIHISHEGRTSGWCCNCANHETQECISCFAGLIGRTPTGFRWKVLV